MFERLLEKLARALEERSIACMVIGGQAVLLYAEPRLTRDVDITLGLPVARLATLLEVIDPLGLLKNPGYDRAYLQRWLADFERLTGAPLRVVLADLESGSV